MPPTASPAPDRGVTVFAPTPILTVTIEADFDDRPELHLHAGGQGFWVARMVARLGVPVALCCPLGGDTGELLDVLIRREGVGVGGVRIAPGNGSYVHDRRGGERREVCSVPGERLSRHEMDDYYNAALAAAFGSRFLALTGQYPGPVVPPDFYRRLAADLRGNDCTVIADLSGEELREALEGGLDVLCLSHEQMLGHGYAGGDSLPELVGGMKSLARAGAGTVVMHRGAESTFALAGGRLLEVRNPRVEPLDHRGGGDTFFALLAVGLREGRPWVETFRRASAAGTLNVTRHGLGTGHPRDIDTLAGSVEVREFDPDRPPG